MEVNMFQAVYAAQIVDPTKLFLVVAIFFTAGAILTLVGLYLNHHRERRNRRRKDWGSDKVLINRAVSEGQMAAEKATKTEGA
jgi:hypothetical protein